MLSAHNISYTYPNDTQALRDVSLECSPGTITGIVGPNGSGKTTLIKALAGLIDASTGEVRLNGGKIGDVEIRDRALQIAYVPQETHMPFSFSAMEVVLMGRSPHLGAFAFESLEDIDICRRSMFCTDTLQFERRSIHELSGGERQRVVLARALAQEAKIMLLDEPTASLDLRHKISFYKLIAARARELGLAVAAAMHDLNMASLFCDSIMLMKGGRCLAFGRPIDVFDEKTLEDAFDVKLRVFQPGTAGQIVILPAS